MVGKIKFNIKQHKIDTSAKPFIIAEIGSNHNGSLKLAKKLILLAKKNGADCVKFQSWDENSLFSKKNYKQNYFLKDDYRKRKDESLFSIVKKYSLKKKQAKILNEFSKKNGIIFNSTPFSYSECDFLVKVLKVPFIKVASMDLNNYPLIQHFAKYKLPIFLSTGMGSVDEIKKAVEVIKKTGNNKIVILHCVSIYPTPINKINLNRILTLNKKFKNNFIGFSDHSLGFHHSITAINLGAKVIEKHFTIDQNMKGWDHKVSILPSDLKNITDYANNYQISLGQKDLIQVESNIIKKAFRRSIVASKNISRGKILKQNDLTFKRPGDGLEPKYLNRLLGRKTNKKINYDHQISFKDLET